MNRSDVTKMSEQKSKVIDGIFKDIDKNVLILQKDVYKSFLKNVIDKLEFDENGNLKDNSFNKNILLSVDKVYNEAVNKSSVNIAKSLINGLIKLNVINSNYFSLISGDTKVKPIEKRVIKNIRSWLGFDDENKLQQNGYLNTLIQSDEVKNKIKNVTLKSVISQTGYNNLKETIETEILGKENTTGAFEKYYRNYTYDTVSQVDRKTSEIYANDLGLEFAIYEGGLIETSRKFCIEHNGNVYHKSEIADFKPEKAIPPNYNPFTDLGGYGCRHHLNWISNQMALLLRPEAKKFIDKKETPKVEPKKEVEKPKEEIKPIEKPKPKPKYQPKDIIEDVDTMAKFRKAAKEISSSEKVTISSKADLNFVKNSLKQFQKLSNEYNLESISEKISFSSGGGYYGQVKYYTSGKVIDVNLGHKTDLVKNREFNISKPESNLNLPKSAVDAENINIATSTHEFFHYITSSKRRSLVDENKRIEFWNKVLDLKNEYIQEVNKLVKSNERGKAGEIYLGRYASTNKDEFAAEAFTQYKLKKEPTKYAKLFGKLLDEYYKK